jgi:hypothetical protein
MPAVVNRYWQDLRALTSLDISNGGLGAEGATYLAQALKDHP